MKLKLGRYFWKIFLVNASLIAVVLSGCIWIIVGQLDRYHAAGQSQNLLAQATTLKIAVQDIFHQDHAHTLHTLARKVGAGQAESLRVTFVAIDGTVWGDSQADPDQMESHAQRPEILQALAEGVGESTRWSHTVLRNMKYVAVRVGSVDHPLGVVRVAMPEQHIVDDQQHVRRLLTTTALAFVLAAIILALALAFIWTRRISRITLAAHNLSRGDLSTNIVVSGRDEITLMGRSLNRMRDKLSRQLDTIDRQRRMLGALVEQLSEGVVVVDANEHIVLINAEAIRLLGLTHLTSDSGLVGQPVERCISHHQLLVMLKSTGEQLAVSTNDKARMTQQSVSVKEKEIRVDSDSGTRHILARVSHVHLPLLDSKPFGDNVLEAEGRVLALTDITELTEAMQMKVDLAANASHELRTPIAAIRAAVETLTTRDDDTDVMTMNNIIDIIARQSVRMERVVRDLLALSRIESSAAVFQADVTDITRVMEELYSTFSEVLVEKKIHWEVKVAENCRSVMVNPDLLRMVLHNLLDNAIQFTPPQGRVTINVNADEGAVSFTVTDTGCGIPQLDQKRIFERFYQVERARTGPDRGTGLGLSIVRHAAIAMDANIILDSVVNQGTCVTLTLPKHNK